MKKTLLLLSAVLMLIGLNAQPAYWVFLADKEGTTFDPYTYFDAKAIERYHQCGADLWDISNYPLQQRYVDGVSALATEEVGTSRWMNAIGIIATPEQAARIAQLPYVLRVQPIESNMHLAEKSGYSGVSGNSGEFDTTLTTQLIRMQGQLFREKGIDGRGMRIAVFDGGFPKVDTHEAFRHLREGKQILKTWNFPKKKEDVYGWNGHGTMTLSCIAGRMNGRDLGLATGAEFLLARTEIEPEPFKEEIWWMQAVEWADKNGANIISSSLGYGKDRYYTKDMDGTSYVAHAGNLAARKGILVFASAGNEGDDRSWRTIVTPSDADSVMCVGGTTHDLDYYSHIDFASYGPTADGRQKPNVSAFAHAMAADPSGNDEYEMVYGTSFSCPLVAGFAACAWQASPGKTNMQMFDLIQRSADLYPYCDYAFGYGVPQASFFVGPQPKHEATFTIRQVEPALALITPIEADSNVFFFVKDMDDNGRILYYGQHFADEVTPEMSLNIDGGHHVMVFYKGYAQTYTVAQPSDIEEDGSIYIANADGLNVGVNYEEHTPASERPKESRWQWDGYFQLGVGIKTADNELRSDFWSPDFHLGFRANYHLTKAYALGIGLDYGYTVFNFDGDDKINDLEQMLGFTQAQFDGFAKIRYRKADISEWSLELYQRVRFLAGGLFHKGMYWDLGVYGSWGSYDYRIKYSIAGDVAKWHEERMIDVSPLSNYEWNFGVTTRFIYNYYGIYARYRLNGIGSDPAAGEALLPRLTVGLQIGF